MRFKQAIIGGLVTLSIVFVIFYFLSNLETAIDAGKCKARMADVRWIAKAIESYRVDGGHYPVAMRIETLQSALEPDYIRLSPWTEFAYFSDGSSYVIQFRSEWPCCGVIEVRDGDWVKWPNCLDWDAEHPSLGPIEVTPGRPSN